MKRCFVLTINKTTFGIPVCCFLLFENYMQNATSLAQSVVRSRGCRSVLGGKWAYKIKATGMIQNKCVSLLVIVLCVLFFSSLATQCALKLCWKSHWLYQGFQCWCALLVSLICEIIRVYRGRSYDSTIFGASTKTALTRKNCRGWRTTVLCPMIHLKYTVSSFKQGQIRFKMQAKLQEHIWLNSEALTSICMACKTTTSRPEHVLNRGTLSCYLWTRLFTNNTAINRTLRHYLRHTCFCQQQKTKCCYPSHHHHPCFIDFCLFLLLLRSACCVVFLSVSAKESEEQTKKRRSPTVSLVHKQFQKVCCSILLGEEFTVNLHLTGFYK